MAADDATKRAFLVVDNEDEAQWQGHEQLWTQVMQADGDEWTLVQLARGERLPADPFTFHGIILTGSHHGILEDAPWMQDLQCFVQKAVRGELPEGGRRPKLLAVCFGAQLLAVALGGASGPNPHGKFVFKTEAVVGTPSLLTAPGFDAEHHWHGPKEAPAPEYRLLETHGDCVLKLPEQAVLLASSPSCEHEMFSVGDSAIALQGHPEFSVDDMMAKIYPDVVGELDEASQTPEDVRSQLETVSGHTQLLSFLRSFFRS